jgi:hypothetical protein
MFDKKSSGIVLITHIFNTMEWFSLEDEEAMSLFMFDAPLEDEAFLLEEVLFVFEHILKVKMNNFTNK